MRIGLFLIAGLAVMAACTPRESGDSAREALASDEGLAAVPEENLIPRRPHPSAAELFHTEDADYPASQLDELVRAADRYMAAQIPDFAIKDATRPWLDRQYIPQSWQPRSEDGRILCDVTMKVLQWDEGRTVEPRRIQLGLEWDGSNWVLEDAPELFYQDLNDASKTLEQEWQRGERQLP